MADLFSMAKDDIQAKHELSSFVLTGSRQLLRILDIGLIVPELAASTPSGKIHSFYREELSRGVRVKGHPRTPVLLELHPAVVKGECLPASSIKSIHFSSEDDLQDFISRSFENIPASLFKLCASPDLFSEAESSPIMANLPKTDREALKARYRALDVQAGALYWLLYHVHTVNELKGIINSLSGTIHTDQLHDYLTTKSIDIAGGEESSHAAETCKAYFRLLSELDVDEGWPRQRLLNHLRGLLPEEAKSSDLMAKWLDYSQKVIAHERDLQPLTDEKQIVLRTILLHLLNPDEEALDRVFDSPLKPGKRVDRLARLMAAARKGFAPILASKKEKEPGGYFFISDLMAAVLNGHPLDGSVLETRHARDERPPMDRVLWRGDILAELPSPPSTSVSEEVDGYDSSTLMCLNDLKLLVGSIEKVAEVISESDDVITLTLNKAAAKGLPRNTSFELKPSEVTGHWILSTRLLDLRKKSHANKLSLKRLRAALVYQTGQGHKFRFDLNEDVSFEASMEFTYDDLTAKTVVDDTIARLVDCHHWMKTSL